MCCRKKKCVTENLCSKKTRFDIRLKIITATNLQFQKKILKSFDFFIAITALDDITSILTVLCDFYDTPCA